MGIISNVKRLPGFCIRQWTSHINALRFGFFFSRARSFRIPPKLKVAGKTVSLHYPSEHGTSSDFFACCIRNDYGLRTELPNLTTILDIGANVGFFSIAARSRYPQAKIHAYEPNQRVLPFLKSNVEPLAVNIFPEAVGAEAGTVSICDDGDSNQATTVANDGGSIRQVSLQRAIERLGGVVDLLKMDCEGAEWDLFKAEEPWRHIRYIRMEYHLVHGHTIQDVQSALSRIGFRAIHWQRDAGFGILWAASSNSRFANGSMKA